MYVACIYFLSVFKKWHNKLLHRIAYGSRRATALEGKANLRIFRLTLAPESQLSHLLCRHVLNVAAIGSSLAKFFLGFAAHVFGYGHNHAAATLANRYCAIGFVALFFGFHVSSVSF
jgi:hypothetical protein